MPWLCRGCGCGCGCAVAVLPGRGEGRWEPGGTVTQLSPAGPFCRSSRRGKEEAIPVTFYKHQRGSVKVFSVWFKTSYLVADRHGVSTERDQKAARRVQRSVSIAGTLEVEPAHRGQSPKRRNPAPCGCLAPQWLDGSHHVTVPAGGRGPVTGPSDGPQGLERGWGEEEHHGHRDAAAPTLGYMLWLCTCI